MIVPILRSSLEELEFKPIPTNGSVAYTFSSVSCVPSSSKIITQISIYFALFN